MYHPRLKGSHYEMGKHYGDLLYKTGENLSSVIKLNEEQKLFGERCLPLYEDYLKDIMDEVKGFADGLHQKYEDVINEYGLCAALTFLLSKKIKPGINGGFIIRKILEECKKIISGKYGFVCQFEKKLNFDTIWSCVYDLNSLYSENL